MGEGSTGWKSTRCSPRFAPRWIFERALGPVFVLVHLGSKSLRKRLFDCWVNTRSSHGTPPGTYLSMQMVNQRWRHLCGPPAFLFRFEYPPLTVFPRAFADPFVDPSSLPPLPLVGKITPPLLQEGRPIPPTKRKSAAAIDRWNFFGRSLTSFVFQWNWRLIVGKIRTIFFSFLSCRWIEEEEEFFLALFERTDTFGEFLSWLKMIKRDETFMF